jgi:hypothetical protein
VHPSRAWTWAATDPDRAVAAVVVSAISGIALAASAAHVVSVGAHLDQPVTGWKVWSVAGTLEVLAFYAAWETWRRETKRARIIPLAVFLLSAAFIIRANTASASPGLLEALPWAEMFAVAPAVVFLATGLIAHSRSWRSVPRGTSLPEPDRKQEKRPDRKRTTRPPVTTKKAVRHEDPPSPPGAPSGPPAPADDAVELALDLHSVPAQDRPYVRDLLSRLAGGQPLPTYRAYITAQQTAGTPVGPARVKRIFVTTEAVHRTLKGGERNADEDTHTHADAH